MEKHYTKAELELYRNHYMSVLGRIACANHLKECPLCAKLMQELQDDDELLQKLKSSVEIYNELGQSGISPSKYTHRSF